jgi:hypothetical protein
MHDLYQRVSTSYKKLRNEDNELPDAIRGKFSDDANDKTPSSYFLL